MPDLRSMSRHGISRRPSRETEKYFKNNPPFNQFDPDCLKDHVLHGTTERETGVELNYNVNVEANIFQTTPYDIVFFRKRLDVPGTVVMGEHSYIPFQAMIKRFAKRHGLLFLQFKEVSHLFPLESPEGTAALI